MSNWSSFLVKKSISPELIKECHSYIPGEMKGALTSPLSASVESPADLRNLRATLKLVNPVLPKSLVESLDEELREIVGDARWKTSARGSYILTVNEWMEPFHSEFRSRPGFANVAIGGHSEREVIFVSGFVESREVFNELMSYVRSKNPPFKIMSDVRIGTWNGAKII